MNVQNFADTMERTNMQKTADGELMALAESLNPDAHRYLCLWAERIETWSPRLGYPRRSAGLSTGGGSGDDAFEHLCEQADSYAARTAEAIVDNLPLPQRAILIHVYLRSVFRYGRVHDPKELLAGALAAFWSIAQGRGLS